MLHFPKAFVVVLGVCMANRVAATDPAPAISQWMESKCNFVKTAENGVCLTNDYDVSLFIKKWLVVSRCKIFSDVLTIKWFGNRRPFRLANYHPNNELDFSYCQMQLVGRLSIMVYLTASYPETKREKSHSQSILNGNHDRVNMVLMCFRSCERIFAEFSLVLEITFSIRNIWLNSSMPLECDDFFVASIFDHVPLQQNLPILKML